MTKKEISLLGLELVAYSGDARSDMLSALKFAKEGKFDKVDELIELSKESLNIAHLKQTEMLQKEACGEYSDVTMIMLHGQDHLMTTVLLKDLIYTLIDIYKK